MQSNDPNERRGLLENLVQDEQTLPYVNGSLSPSRPTVMASPIALTAAERSLKPDEAILEYVLADPASYCLVITRTKSAIIKLPAGRKQIQELTSAFLNAVQAGKPATNQAQPLYAWLIALLPAEVQKPRIIIVPDGRLHVLPFECLQDASGHYLIESRVISYAPSATTLYYLKAAQRTRPAKLALLGLGGVEYQTGNMPFMNTTGHRITRAVSRGIFDLTGVHLNNLPASRSEVTGVSQALGRQDSVLLVGGAATETAFKREPLGDFKIIYLAVHAAATPKYPERSALLLGRDPKSSDDGLLQVREIVNLPLNADLVTLSACDTGKGKLEGEEGEISLVQAFLVAGARSVVAALWNVDDASTATLMVRFYTYLAKGEDKAAALRDAKLDLLRSLTDNAPAYWAGFTLTGDGDTPINFSQ